MNFFSFPFIKMKNKNTYYDWNKEKIKNMHEIVIIQRMVKQNQKDIMKITKKFFQKKHKLVA